MTISLKTSAAKSPSDAPGDGGPLLRFRNLRKSFGSNTVLNGVSGEIRRGDVILLRGENGSGKTTLLNILTGSLEPDSGAIEFSSDDVSTSQTFQFPCPWHRKLNPFQCFTPEKVARLGVGRTWQDIRLFSSLDLADNIAAASPNIADSPWAAIFRPRRTRATARRDRFAASDRLISLGLIDKATSSADKTSLGQSKRVAIARALQTGARFLLLDEPLSGLDEGGVHEAISQLTLLAAQQEVAVLIVEHTLNLARIHDIASTVWTLKSGHLIAESRSTTSAYKDGAALLRPNLHDLFARHFGSAVPTTCVEIAGSANITTYWLRGKPTLSDKPILTVSNLVIQRGNRTLFNSHRASSSSGLSFALMPHTVNVLDAPNGWGKSSLQLALAGLITISHGTLTFCGQLLNNDSPWTRNRNGLANLLSDNHHIPSLTALELLALAGHADSSAQSAFQFPVSRRVSELSGGQKQQLALATIRKSIFGIYDEPFCALDSQLLRPQHLSAWLQKHDAILVLNPSSKR